MNDFVFFLSEGWHHIISRDALDHVLFIAALAVVYVSSEWRKILILVTAFTIGHAFTLVLSVLDILRFRDAWVEFLIPCTIVITAAVNLLQRDFTRNSLRVNYFLAFFFGLIHGMGYANAIRFSLAKGQSLAAGLLSFNLGLEIGQIFVVLFILLMGYLFTSIPGVTRARWVKAVSVIVLALALGMVWERVPF
jgi:uncharacterized membrane-anchored protein YitT (DUF2179 family)